MIPYIGCEQARELLDGLLDDELCVDDQVAVESHLRWCRTCAFRVEDLRLIGTSLRMGSPLYPPSDDDTRVLTAIHSGVLMRIRAEHEQTLGFRLREMFADMRLFWPAIGATLAVFIGVSVALTVLHSASVVVEPQSLAAMIDRAAQSSRPGSIHHPLLPDNNVSIPRMLDDGAVFARMPHDEAVYAVAAMVTSDGRIANYELLLADPGAESSTSRARVDQVVLDAVRRARLAPAQTPGGQAVAVNMVWLIATTKAVKEPPLDLDTPVARPLQRPDVVKPAAEPPAEVDRTIGRRRTRLLLTTA